jgi:hypothetical protein
MTRRKNTEGGPLGLQLRLLRFRSIALNLERSQLSPIDEGGFILGEAERDFLTVALRRIGRGEDPAVVLEVKAMRGERRTIKEVATRRKSIGRDPLSPLQLRLASLQRMALNLASTKLSPSEMGGPVLNERQRDSLAVALWRVGHGEDPAAVLGVKARRGERRSIREAAKSDKIRFALSWIAKVTSEMTEEEKKYLTRPTISLNDAFSRAAEHFGYDEDSLRTYWFSHPELHSPSFDRPITSLP